MDIIEDPAQMREWSRVRRVKGRRVALVPTMGCLHEGHLSLVDIAGSAADAVAVSIFVNPIQFGPAEDFEKYPRAFDRDVELCRKRGVAVVFAPDSEMFYAGDHSVYVDETKLSSGLCGAVRPGHFRGVATVVCKLLNVVEPDVAVFGRKDAQQAAVIGRMLRDLNMPQQMITGPIVREADGLAMSSRNRYLSQGERSQAVGIYRGLVAAKNESRCGVNNSDGLRSVFCEELTACAADAKIEYVEVVDAETMQCLDTIDVPALLLVAVKIGSTRLIDNIELG